MLLCSRCATISSSDLTVQPNVSPGSVLALDAHALQFVCIMLFMHHRVCSLHFYAWYFMCIKYHMYHISVYKILFAPNFSFIIKKCTILCTVHITFIPKLTTKNCLYLIPGTRPGISSSSSILFWIHIGKHLENQGLRRSSSNLLTDHSRKHQHSFNDHEINISSS